MNDQNANSRKQRALDKFMAYRESALEGEDCLESQDLREDLAGICIDNDSLWAAYREVVRATHTPYNEHPELVALFDAAQKALEEA